MAEELTRETRDRRIAVAKDVLKQLAREDVPLQVRQGVYLEGRSGELKFSGTSLQPHVDQLQRHCEACMLGAAFLSYARLFNGVETDCIYRGANFLFASSCSMRSHLETVFDGRTLDRMEHAFEGWNEPREIDEADDEDGYEKHVEACIAAGNWGQQFGNKPRDAIRAICNILIENGGEFILPAPVALREGVR